MRYGLNRVSVIAFIAASLVAVLFLGSRPAASQNGAAAQCFGCSVDGKTTPMKDGHPDLSGMWGGGGGGGGAAAPAAEAPAAGRGGGGGQQFERDSDGSILFDFSLNQANEPPCLGDSCQAPNQPSYTPEFMAKVKEIAATEFNGTTPLDPTKNCEPAGVPRAGFGGLVVETPQAVVMYRGDYTDRVIYIDGRPHPDDLDSAYNGDSIGHWEGNTLVVDTIGLNTNTWLGGGSPNTIYTSIHSDKEHVIERWTREVDVINVETTVEDPIALTKPWVLPVRKVRIVTNAKPEYPQPYYCDGGGISALMRDHFVRPSPEDKDIKYKCPPHNGACKYK